MNIKKRFLAAILSVSVISACCLTVLPDNMMSKFLDTDVSAATEYTYEDFTYTTQEGKASITGYTGTAADVVIPADIDNYPVTIIGQGAFANNRKITSVVLPDSIELIDYMAFCGCTRLASVNMPTSLTKISGLAFSQTGIQSFDLPEGLTVIGEFAFSSCENLSSVSIPKSMENMYASVFSGCTNLTAVSLPDNLTEIPNFAFNNCEKLETINIPESVLVIGKSAFSGCKSITSIKLPPNLTKISENAFWNCTGLQAINIPDNVDSIGMAAFQGCKSLQTINIPAGVSVIQQNVFFGCENLETISLPDTLTEILTNAFNGCTGLDEIILPDSVTSVGISAFQGCTSLSEIKLSSAMTAVSDSTFYNCTALKEIVFPESIKSIGSKAFYNCQSLTSVITSEVTTIGSFAFAHCSALSTVDLPEVTSIGGSAFLSCTALENVNLDLNADLEDLVFTYCSKLKYINSIEVTLTDEEGCPYFDERLDSFVMDNFRSSSNVEFIDTYVEYDVKYIVGQVTTDSMTDMEKAVALHDWVCNKVDYDYSEDDNPKNHVDSAIFLNDLVVCEGYARGYCLLMQAAGIEAYYISGTTNSGVGHMWNIIKLDDHYFHVDCCWDDTSGKKYGYFLLNDEQISASRHDWVMDTPFSDLYHYVQNKLPVCTYSMGDVNKDGSADTSDAAMLQEYLVNKSEIAGGDSVLANLTHDGNVDVFDVISLKRMSLAAE